MADLFRRTWAIQVGDIRIAGTGAGGGASTDSLDAAFEINKTTQREPNTASVKIWNLSRSHRQALESTDTLPLRVEAGYVDHSGVLFDGDVRVAASRSRAAGHRSRQSRMGSLGAVSDVVDIVTEIEAEDGGTAYRDARVQRSFGDDTPVATVLRAAVDAMGIGHGNLNELAADPTMGDISTYSEGTVLSGQAHREVDRIVRSIGLRWSVQSGVLQLKRGRAPLQLTAVRLTPSTGLVGSPAPDADGYVEAVALLNPGLYPGRPVVLESRDVSGSYGVRRAIYTGDTAGADWYVTLTLEAR